MKNVGRTPSSARDPLVALFVVVSAFSPLSAGPACPLSPAVAGLPGLHLGLRHHPEVANLKV
jgi:hypothetical protein